MIVATFVLSVVGLALAIFNYVRFVRHSKNRIAH